MDSTMTGWPCVCIQCDFIREGIRQHKDPPYVRGPRRSQGSRWDTCTKRGEEGMGHAIPALINDTPSSITEKLSTHSLNGFSHYVKNFYVSKYNTVCSIANCYICNRQ